MAVAVFVGLAVVHVSDNYHVDHVTGTWMGLTAYADDGVLYPPLHDDGYFGGTRYGPLGIAVNTVAAKVSGEYLVSGKVVAFLTMSVLLGAAYVLARRLGVSRAVSLAAVGAAIATPVALFAGTTVYGDVLAAALQVSAIAVIAKRVDRRGVVVSGVLAALAITAKPTAVWGAATVVIWLLMRERRQLAAFVAAAGATAVAVFGAALVASDGRMLDNVLGLSGAGSLGIDRLVDTPQKAWDLMVGSTETAVIVLPIVVVWIIVAARRSTLTVVDIALAVAALVTLVIIGAACASDAGLFGRITDRPT